MNAGITIPVPDRFRSAAYRDLLATQPANQSVIWQEGVRATMYEAASRGYPNEICGLLVGRIEDSGWRVQEAREVTNINTDRADDRFQLDPAGYQRIDRELRGSGQEIIGVFHSHPDCPARPSPTDLDSAWEGFLYPILGVCQGEVAEMLCWSLTEDGKQFQRVNEH